MKLPRPRRILRTFIILALLLATLYLLLEKSLAGVILDTAYTRAYSIAVDTMNEAVRRSISGEVSYADLITVHTDQDGRVTMLQSNTARMNELAVTISLSAQDALSDNEHPQIAVPLGAALGVPFLSSVGPRLHVKLVPVGAVSASFVSEFETAGINQTRHKIYLELHATVRLVLPTGARAVNVDTQLLIAESIIVGDVPQSYIQVPEMDDTLNFAI